MFRSKLLWAACLLGGSLSLSTAAQAVPVYAPVTNDLIVTAAGFEWVWASPCSGGCSTIDFSFQGALGWRFATTAEFLLRPIYAAFVDSNQPFGIKCASSFFDSYYTHCDAGDFAAGFVVSQPNGNAYETLLVRSSVSAVPVPAALPLLLTAVAGLAAARRRKKAKASAA
jgi:hypothetical protein